MVPERRQRQVISRAAFIERLALLTHGHVIQRVRAAVGAAALLALLCAGRAAAQHVPAGLDTFLPPVAGSDTAGSDRVVALGRLHFFDPARCAGCHVGPNLTDEAFHNTGVTWRRGAPADRGRFGVTGDSSDIGSFRTPTLREVARTAPYMHDGSMATLEDVTDFYDGGGSANPRLDERIRPLGLTAGEKHALLAFLRTLTGTVREGVPVGAASYRQLPRMVS